MKGYLIDAGTRAITPIDYDYGTITKFLPGGICIAQVFSNGDVTYVDDEGLLRPAKVAFRIKSRADGQPLMSNAIHTGRDTVNDTLAPAFTIEHLAAQIEWLTVGQALSWFRARANEAAVVGTHIDGTQVVYARWRDVLFNLEGGQGFNTANHGPLMRSIAR